MGKKRRLGKEDFFDDYGISNHELNHFEIVGQASSFYYQNLKVLLDFCIALISILLVSPFLLIFIIIIKMDSKGPAFYIQERVGLHGQYIRLVKLRTMVVQAELNGPQWARREDPRVTRVGRWLRKTRIDELPQLLNVLKGEMSIVGPRPERPSLTAAFNQQYPFIRRLSIKPGITGWAQVNGGYELSPQKKLEYDLFYIQHLSFLLDMRIILKTFFIMINGVGAR